MPLLLLQLSGLGLSGAGVQEYGIYKTVKGSRNMAHIRQPRPFGFMVYGPYKTVRPDSGLEYWGLRVQRFDFRGWDRISNNGYIK